MASIEKTDTKRWRARYRDPSGRSRSRTFDTKAEAQRFLNGVGADMQRGQWVDPAMGTTKLAHWAEEFLRTAHDLDPSTRATYERDLRRYVLPRFDDTAMCKIRKLDVRAWINDELGQGLAASSVHRHFRTLRRVLNVAVGHELLARSPCVGLSGPRVEATEMRFLNAEEVRRVAEELPPQFRTLVYTAAYTGMRRGELIGLRRGSVDLAAPAITVVEQLVILDGSWVRKTPKTAAGRRRITLPAFLAESNWRSEPVPDPTAWCSRTEPGTRSTRRASTATTGSRPRSGPGSRASDSTTSEIPRWPWPSRGSPPQDHPGPDGPRQRPDHPRPLRTPLPRARSGRGRRARPHLPRRPPDHRRRPRRRPP